VGFNSKTNTQIHLKDILKGGEVKEEYTEACIRRSNGKSMILVSANLADSDTGTATKLMQSAAKEVLADYNGYSFESSGISSYLNDAFEGLAVALVVSFFLLYAVMAIQFSSFVKPLIVMASIPFSFTGGFIALVITGTSLNVVSFIGLIMLMGVVVNNAIVMLEKIKQLNEEGKTKYDSVIEACRLRLRPILMTTLTTILALVPLAIGVGQGSELMQPLGIVVIGGLLLSTLVTLVLVPTVYCAVYGITPKQKDGRAKGKKINAEAVAEA
jgi:HAE1 family hydrophobic/amphiphilic exporter-1